MTRQTHLMRSSPYSKPVSIEKSSNMRRETRLISLSPHSTPVLVDKSIDERNMGRQNHSDNVKVLESRKNVVGQSEKKKSKVVRVDDVEGKRKYVVEDEVNLGVKPKQSKVQKAEKVKIPDKVCKAGQYVRTSLLVSSTSQGIRGKLPIDNSDNFVRPPRKLIKEPVPPKKMPGVQPIDCDRELQKLKADVKQLHKPLKSFMEYVSDKFKEVFELINSKLGASEDKYGAHPDEGTCGGQDNNDFVNNMEFDGNEDIDMDGRWK
ncbi:uncharacterized protein [Nicotiana tomentosiformis]|uniref:uncharacterized protein n=1 Tax=Nicotiana tomentosiformis TaxID=4098 RepID=UPI00051BE3E9|nr:uncharacterized protein LOC104089483 [Nicotiana tomentosiformis]